MDCVLLAATTGDAQKATVVPKLKDSLDEIRDIINATATEAAKAAEAAAGGGEPPPITIVGALHNPQCKIGVSTGMTYPRSENENDGVMVACLSTSFAATPAFIIRPSSDDSTMVVTLHKRTHAYNGPGGASKETACDAAYTVAASAAVDYTVKLLVRTHGGG